jgi:FkbM family methyltransferase
MIAAFRRARSRWVGRFCRAGRALEAAHGLGLPLTRSLDRSWAAAVETARFSLLPAAVRDDLRVVVDVGANRGDWTAAILKLAHPEASFAFEPNPEVFERLQARLEPLGVHCVRAAAGARAGVATLHVEAQSELSSLRRLSQRGRRIHGIEAAATRQLAVPVVALDDELHGQGPISLLKLDVQGYEDEVIAGARRVLARTSCLVTEVMYERDYYAGASPCLELARLIEDVSPLRLSCVSSPALAPDGLGAWADAVFINPSASARPRGASRALLKR